MLRVNPPCGPLDGWRDGAVTRYTGIPYATAARFAAPIPAADHADPLAATSWSPPCPQLPSPLMNELLGRAFGDAAPSEDCLNLSVTVPADGGEKMPVMVWIHGGSYAIGAGDVPIMDPAALVAEQHVIVVTVTYRLGLFGYGGGAPGRPANLGLLDQREALRWVQRNIAAFGGDATQVTAFGQSAGGDAVANLMALEEAPTLFARAIIQSAPLGIARRRERMNVAVARVAAGVAADAPVADVVAAESAVAKVGLRFGLKGAMPFATRFGHDPLPTEDRIDAAQNAVAPRIDVLIGNTAQEARLFAPAVLQRLGRVGAVLSPLVAAALTEVVYGRAGRRFARRHARSGGRALHYVIGWRAPGNAWGSAHMVDLPLLFGAEETWRGAGLVAGSSWSDLTAAGSSLRAVWGGFARGEALGSRGSVPGVLRWRRV
ncbi:carboxylesterase/lipase family protein [Microbacteriaceae bacterium VKM Ac-2854]|nr:carboxylesterase/lipase family protein [Microbacteriaceae bacterium VKM Ac-2854]